MKISFCRTPVSPNSEGKLSRWSGIQQAFALAALLFDGHGEGAKIIGNLRIFRRQRIDVANLDIDGLYAWPFGARTEEPAVTSDHTRGVERIAGNQELQQLPAAQVGPNHNVLVVPSTCSISTSSGSPR